MRNAARMLATATSIASFTALEFDIVIEPGSMSQRRASRPKAPPRRQHLWPFATCCAGVPLPLLELGNGDSETGGSRNGLLKRVSGGGAFGLSNGWNAQRAPQSLVGQRMDQPTTTASPRDQGFRYSMIRMAPTTLSRASNRSSCFFQANALCSGVSKPLVSARIIQTNPHQSETISPLV